MIENHRITQSAHISEVFPPRTGTGIERSIEELTRDSEVLLSEQEKQAVLDYERVLLYDSEGGSETLEGLETVWKKLVLESEFYLDYFLTPEGKQLLMDQLGVHETEVDFDSLDEIETFFYRLDYSNFDTKNVDILSGSSRQYSEEVMLQQFEAQQYAVTDAVENPRKMSVVRNPKILFEKISGYRKLKEFYKQEKASLESELYELQRDAEANESRIRVVHAQRALLKIYRRRLNTLIAELYYAAYKVTVQSEAIGLEYDFADYFKSIGQNPNEGTIHKILSRLDRFINGSGDTSSPISAEIEHMVAESRIAGIDSEGQPVDNHDKTGIETEAMITASELKNWMEVVLRQHDLLSSSTDFDSDREGPAEDGKWQVVITPKSTSISRNSRQKVIKIAPDFKRTISSLVPAGAIPVLDHELTHLFQDENRIRLGLRIFDNVRTDRATATMEAGAIMVETETQKELFGQERKPNFNYYAAVKRRLNGGSYKECVKAFYDSLMATDPDSDKRKAMKLAINRTARLFRGGGRFDSTDGSITNSKDLVYLEQEFLAEQLAKVNAQRFLFIGGVSLQTLAELHAVGLFDESKMQYPTERPSDTLRKLGYFAQFGIN